ncbi:MAG: inositol monophosphatase [Desulfuromonas sp.]|nr:MAG: inositol monophosphatase [Desulfuromonas sp.]
MIADAVEIARAGGDVLRELFRTGVSVEHKGEVDLVTEADRAAEQQMVELLRERFPHDDILAEEGDYGRRTKERCWVLDPLDGTTNFAHGFPWFAVSLGLLKGEQLVAGVLYNPCYEELYQAELGGGAYLNGQPLQVSTTAQLDQALLATGFPYDRKHSSLNNYDHFINFQQAAQACRRPGAASLDLASVAAGRFDGYWEMKLKPWDTAAGALLVTEAGGRLSNFSGGEFDSFIPQVVASNGLVHEAMLGVLAQGKTSV